jgi:hypothetical protein
VTHLLAEVAQGTVEAVHLTDATVSNQSVACCWMSAETEDRCDRCQAGAHRSAGCQALIVD